MAASILIDFSRLCLHTMTTKPWNLTQCVENYRDAGIAGITIWRNLLDRSTIKEAPKVLRDNNMHVVSLCRGGFFASASKLKRAESIADNLRAIDEASVIGASLIILVCGSDMNQSLEKSREQIKEGILKILPQARSAGIRLAVEPLHPMYAGDRSAINTMKQANDLVAQINSEWVGIAVDTFHVWWDNTLREEIRVAGEGGSLFAFHVSDWLVPMTDFLNDRGLMGTGCIDIPGIRGWVEESGFKGFIEVEIFSKKYWSMDQLNYLSLIKQAFLDKT
jgi:sugar phosphate isomerase/epimerase